MVIVDLNNTNDNAPTITCEPVEVIENSQEGFGFTDTEITVSNVVLCCAD